MGQEIQYATASDGVRLAYAVIGKGPPILRTSHWLTHLEFDLKSPVTRHLVLGLARRHTLVRYDSRGCGLSQRDVAEVSFERWVSDLGCVADKVLPGRFVLYGASQGVAIAVEYAARHPDRVSRLILHGGYARGHLRRGDPEKSERNLDLQRALIREGWGSEHETYRTFFTSQLIPDGTAEQWRWFNDLERASASPEMAERFLNVVAGIDVTGVLPRVRVPTLVLHCRDDRRVPFAFGQEIAAGIPGAKLVPLESNNHVVLAHEAANRASFDAITDFLGEARLRGALPGTIDARQRVERAVRSVEQNWLMKVIGILAAVTGVVIFGFEMWKLLRE